MLEKVVKYLGLAVLPEKEEVTAALSHEIWRTKTRILEVINENREQHGERTLDTSGLITGMFVNYELGSRLQELEKASIAQSKTSDLLTQTEMSASDDPKLTSSVAIHNSRRSRRGRPDIVYKKGSGGHKSRSELEASSAGFLGGIAVTD